MILSHKKVLLNHSHFISQSFSLSASSLFLLASEPLLIFNLLKPFLFGSIRVLKGFFLWLRIFYYLLSFQHSWYPFFNLWIISNVNNIWIQVNTLFINPDILWGNILGFFLHIFTLMRLIELSHNELSRPQIIIYSKNVILK